MAAIDGVFCLKMGVVHMQTRATSRSTRLSGVRLWTVITLQTLQWAIGDKS